MAAKIAQPKIEELIKLVLQAELAKTTEQFTVVNSKLSGLGIKVALDLEGGNKMIIKEQLMHLIYKGVKGTELKDKDVKGKGAVFYEFLKQAHEDLNGELEEESPSNSAPTEEDKVQALRNMQTNFLHYEARSTHRKSLLVSVLSCLLIVTIPFVKLIYNGCHKSFAKKHFFERAFIANEVLEKQPGKNIKSSYGLLRKHTTHGILSKKDNIRKYTDDGKYSTIASDRKLVDKGLFFLGTKAQIESTKQKFAGRAAPSL